MPNDIRDLFANYVTYTNLLEKNNESSKSQNGSITTNDTHFTIPTEIELSINEEEDNVRVMLDRWCNESFKDGPYVAYCHEEIPEHDSAS